MPYLLEISNVSFSYCNSPVIKDVSLKLNKGELVALCGRNGSGKSTLAQIITGVLNPDSGSVLLDGLDIFAEDYRPIPGEIGLMFQDPSEGILAVTVEREIAFTPENACFSTERIRQIVDKLAEDFGLRGEIKKNIDELSGGFIEKCALAASLAADPKLLVLDEPDAFLDWQARREFWNKLTELKSKGTTIILITQSVETAGHCDKAFTLKDGVLECGFPNNIKIAPLMPTTLNNGYHKIEDLSFSFDSKPVIKGINLQVKAGERFAIFGANGSGKTSLARACAGVYRPDSGSVVFFDENNIPKEARIAVSFQFPARQLFAENVLADVAFGPRNFRINDPDQKAREALDKVGIPQEMHLKSPFQLSDGQQRWVGIAGVLAMEPDFIFFDEPTASLDSIGKERFRNLLGEMRGTTIGLITHDYDFAKLCVDRLIVIAFGQIVWDGAIETLDCDDGLRRSLGVFYESEVFV